MIASPSLPPAVPPAIQAAPGETRSLIALGPVESLARCEAYVRQGWFFVGAEAIQVTSVRAAARGESPRRAVCLTFSARPAIATRAALDLPARGVRLRSRAAAATSPPQQPQQGTLPAG